ncbi:MAG: hypothetical protein HZC47_01595 [Methanobacterium sp.]|nr:hypothetical protein [Methanobacterium sp.]
MDRRASIIRREFTAIKQEKSYEAEDYWIKSRLEDDSNDLEDIIMDRK